MTWMNDNVLVRNTGLKRVLMKAFAHKGARDFDDGYWLRLFMMAALRNRLEYCQDKDGNVCYLRAIQEHLVVFLFDWKKYL